MKPSRTRIAAACLTLATWLPMPAHAGILDDNEARRAIVAVNGKLDAMTRDLTEARTKIDTKLDKSSAIDILNQIEQTMQEVAGIRGQIEQLTNRVETAEKNEKILYADLDARFRKFESKQQSIAVNPAETIPEEKQRFDVAWNLFRLRNYDGAAKAFTDFVTRYPDSADTPKAQHWLGNAYYALSDYKRAIAAQDVVARTYKDSAEAPDALLNIASSYAELKDKNAARKTLQQLIRTFPASAAAQAAKDRLAPLEVDSVSPRKPEHVVATEKKARSRR
jgi:tol-pal system protein YbgF